MRTMRRTGGIVRFRPTTNRNPRAARPARNRNKIAITAADLDLNLPNRQRIPDDSVMNSRINHVAVVVSAIVQWIIGGVWYAALGNVWLNLHAKTMTDIETPNAVLPYVIAFLAALF